MWRSYGPDSWSSGWQAWGHPSSDDPNWHSAWGDTDWHTNCENVAWRVPSSTNAQAAAEPTTGRAMGDCAGPASFTNQVAAVTVPGTQTDVVVPDTNARTTGDRCAIVVRQDVSISIPDEPSAFRIGPERHRYDYQRTNMTFGGAPVYMCTRCSDTGLDPALLFIAKDGRYWTAYEAPKTSDEPWLHLPVFRSDNAILSQGEWVWEANWTKDPTEQPLWKNMRWPFRTTHP